MDQRQAGPAIVGLGNALVDVLADVDAEAVARHGLTKGGMHLVEAETAEALYREVGPGLRQSGGSVANTIAHARAGGLAASYIGKVAADELGDAFAGDFAALGIGFDAPRLAEGPGTGRCVVLVTPDGERTMSTFLGAAQALSPGDVEAAWPARADILLVEGYLWDAPAGPAAIETAARLAAERGARIALTPSDAGCVERNREGMLAFVEAHCDVLIGNESEFGALAGETAAEAALAWARARVEVAALTRSEAGSLVTDGTEIARISALQVDRVVDTTGAGDAYAAGFLAGLALGERPAAAGRRGARIAAGVVTHHGARQGTAAAA